MMQPVYFATPAEFRDWLALHSGAAELLWVGYYKAGSGKASVTWPESDEQALCFGWIDGRRQRIDAQRYMIRFSPRKAGSVRGAVGTVRGTAQAPSSSGKVFRDSAFILSQGRSLVGGEREASGDACAPLGAPH